MLIVCSRLVLCVVILCWCVLCNVFVMRLCMCYSGLSDISVFCSM